MRSVIELVFNCNDDCCINNGFVCDNIFVEEFIRRRDGKVWFCVSRAKGEVGVGGVLKFLVFFMKRWFGSGEFVFWCFVLGFDLKILILFCIDFFILVL